MQSPAPPLATTIQQAQREAWLPSREAETRHGQGIARWQILNVCFHIVTNVAQEMVKRFCIVLLHNGGHFWLQGLEHHPADNVLAGSTHTDHRTDSLPFALTEMRHAVKAPDGCTCRHVGFKQGAGQTRGCLARVGLVKLTHSIWQHEQVHPC